MNRPPGDPRCDGAGGCAVVVVVVTHRGRSDMLSRCLDSIESAGGANALIVVDNNELSPVDSTTDHGPAVTAIVRTPNRGFGAAANAGIERARGLAESGTPLCVALLNDDVVVTDGWLDPLVAALTASDRIGVVQPKLLFAGTDPALVNSVGVRLDATGAGTDIGRGATDGPEWRVAGEIEMFTGGALLMRDTFLRDLGGFDERYFLYYEDVDLALRGAARGWRFRCEPSSIVLHEGSTTTSALGDEVRRLQDRNRLWIAFRFGSLGAIRRAVWLSVRRLRHSPRRAHALGLAQGLAAAPRLVFERTRHR